MEKRINVSRSKTQNITMDMTDMTSIGASYSHIKSLKNIVNKSTNKIIMYHTLLESLDGLEQSDGIDLAYLGFNRIKSFSSQDQNIKKINVLDLVGNPIESLEYCPPCDILIISSTRIKNLFGCPEDVKIIRCGHSCFIESLAGCPKSVKIIECSCSPNLKINKNDLPDDLEELITDDENFVWEPKN